MKAKRKTHRWEHRVRPWKLVISKAVPRNTIIVGNTEAALIALRGLETRSKEK